MAAVTLHQSYSGQSTPAHSYLEHTGRELRAEGREYAAVRPVSARSWQNSIRSASAGAPTPVSCAALPRGLTSWASPGQPACTRAEKYAVRAGFALCTSTRVGQRSEYYVEGLHVRRPAHMRAVTS